MKKILNYLMISVVFISFIGCAGMPESGYSSENSVLMGGNQQEITLLPMGNSQPNEIVGLWKAQNVKNSTHSEISFGETGYVREVIYSNLTGEIINTLEGQYTLNNDILEISIIKGDVSQFKYLLRSGQLMLKSLSN